MIKIWYEQFTTKNIYKKKTDFKWNPQPQR